MSGTPAANSACPRPSLDPPRPLLALPWPSPPWLTFATSGAACVPRVSSFGRSFTLSRKKDKESKKESKKKKDKKEHKHSKKSR